MKKRALWVAVVLCGAYFSRSAVWAEGTKPSLLSSLKNCLKDPAACFASSSTSAASGPVLARVGDAVITASDYQERVDRVPAPYRSLYQTPLIRKQMLESMIDQKVAIVAARKLGLDREDSYQRQMAVSEENLLNQVVRSRFCAVSDAEIAKYYQEHKKDFEPRLQVLVSQIQVKTLPEAKKAQARLSAGKGGALPNRLVFSLSPRHRPAVLEEVLSHLRVGQVSAPLKVSAGYQVLRKEKEERSPASSLQAAKSQIKSRIESAKLNEWTKQQRSSIPVTIDEKALDALK